jgi:hypothetical protein
VRLLCQIVSPMNLLELLPCLTKQDCENIALVMRCYGPPDHPLQTNYPDYLKAAAAIPIIGLSSREEVLAALRKAAPFYQPANDTIRKLESKCRSHPGVNK